MRWICIKRISSWSHEINCIKCFFRKHPGIWSVNKEEPEPNIVFRDIQPSSLYVFHWNQNQKTFSFSSSLHVEGKVAGTPAKKFLSDKMVKDRLCEGTSFPLNCFPGWKLFSLAKYFCIHLAYLPRVFQRGKLHLSHYLRFRIYRVGFPWHLSY